jgi:hypothetical protein
MTYHGVVHGRRIDLDEPVPLRDGQRVRVSVEPCAAAGTPSAVLAAALQEPRLGDADVAELQRAIDAGRLPIRNGQPFGEGDA